jgi:ribosomal protein L37AE/L43A
MKEYKCPKCNSKNLFVKNIDDANSKQDDIASIIYSTLDHMYCDNCRFNSEIKESDNGEWNCDECHRKYNGWGISMQESNKIAKEILKQLGE